MVNIQRYCVTFCLNEFVKRHSGMHPHASKPMFTMLIVLGFRFVTVFITKLTFFHVIQPLEISLYYTSLI